MRGSGVEAALEDDLDPADHAVTSGWNDFRHSSEREATPVGEAPRMFRFYTRPVLPGHRACMPRI